MPGTRFSRLHIIGALLALLVVVFGVTWLALGPGRPPVVNAPPAPPPAPKVKEPPPVELAPPPVRQAVPPDPQAIDPDIQRQADELADHTESPARDLEIVGDFIALYRKVFQQGNPIGLNEDITAVLTGQNPRKGILFPPGSPMIVKGRLVDRWGTPYWFHPNNSHQMEIRSAGPDKDLFTRDDVVMNPGPDNMGIGLGMARP